MEREGARCAVGGAGVGVSVSATGVANLEKREEGEFLSAVRCKARKSSPASGGAPFDWRVFILVEERCCPGGGFVNLGPRSEGSGYGWYVKASALDGLGRTVVRHVHDVVDVVRHGCKEIEKQFAAADFHLVLHGSASLENLARSDNQCQKVRTQFGILVRSVFICIPCRPEDGINRDSCLQSLFPKSQALQFVEAESTYSSAAMYLSKTASALVGSAVDDGVFE